jgi:hypothetical protein
VTQHNPIKIILYQKRRITSHKAANFYIQRTENLRIHKCFGVTNYFNREILGYYDFLDEVLCSLVVYRRFSGSFCLYNQGCSSIMLTETASSIEASVHQNTRCHIQEDGLFHTVTMFVKQADAFKFSMALGCQ